MRWLLVDKILELSPGKSAVGVKNVTMSEHFLEEHFPGLPIMPGVLILEALAQLGGKLIYKTILDQDSWAIPILTMCQKAKFKRFVTPGEQIILEVTLEALREDSAKVLGKAKVNQFEVASADLFFVFVDEQSLAKKNMKLTKEQVEYIVKNEKEQLQILMPDYNIDKIRKA
jgi:3-hydroxyacyl-[acyl-carrier-protein] dehydratase